MKMSDKEVFNKIFKKMRENGYVAVQNYKSSQSMAWRRLSERDKSGKMSKIVFYNNSDGNAFNYKGNLSDVIYLSWKGSGKSISKYFEDEGYSLSWNGKDNQRIGVKPKNIG